MPIPQRPTKLGPYEVIAKIAGGGMANIYLGRARDLMGAEKVAAIKVMRHDFGGDQEAHHMFLDEAKLLSRLSHPNIIQTLEFGTSDEHPFIAMELLLGRTVMDVWQACVEQGIAFRFDIAAWIAARVAEGLHHAHVLTDETGAPLHLIHRDVNPSNIFLTFDGRVKLFDFGLAKARQRRQKSSAGIVKGKLSYLAPEQIMELPLDARCDIYTLGTTLWEMTTMRRLFKRDTDADTVRAVRSAAIPDPQQIVQGYPDPLAKIVRRSLERNREHRYPTAHAFAEDLDSYLSRIGAPDCSALVPGMLDRLFPGERARQMGWLKSLTSPTPSRMPSLRTTVTPPIVIPTNRTAQEGSIPPSPSSHPAPSGPSSAPRTPPSMPPPPNMRPSAPPPPVPSSRDPKSTK